MRWPWLLAMAVLLVGLGAWISRTSHGSGVVGGISPSVDSLRAVQVRDSLVRVASRERRRADSLTAYLDTCPADTVPRWFARNVPVLIHDTTHDTVRLPASLARAVAESLVLCRLGRDSLGGEILVSRERTRSYAEGLALCQRSLGGTPAPSSGGTTWTVSGLLQVDGEALRPGLGVDWRQGRLSVGAEGYARRDGTQPGMGVRIGINFGGL